MSVTVAVRGGTDGDAAEALVDRLRTRPDADGIHRETVTVTDHEQDAALVCAVGDDALHSLAVEPAPVPVLPVATSTGRHDASIDRLDEFLATLTPSDLRALTASHPVLSVDTDSAEMRGVLDVALVTGEPAHISEYTAADGSGDLASFRADGVVVATPAGSAGYGHAAGGPVLAAETGLAVVPVSPYTTQPRTWVVEAPVTLGVERDEVPVSLVVDGRERGQVGVGDTVVIDVARRIDLVRPPSPTEVAGRLEKL